MRAMIQALLLVGLAAPAFAQAPLSAAEFERFATGRTLSYALGGQTFGTERYLPGRRVVWAFEGDECQYGRWYPQDDQICFAYDGEEPQCWTFWEDGGGLAARYMNHPDGGGLSEVTRATEPLHCPGPEVGV
ncbi:hypothetical protein [Falsirhodobacter algicola]|uniref:Uncharacterized protein n=1 Tax=Falsirhodobacter algicola TaxID=2692330 RepID=A0A8J8MQX8_9RHOB|nr:hypothetical protein [Falsirhodobacter algicola]QUS34884.1 hypothetical protein GR316_00525 [Falsirhodobacter algicola]